MKRYVVLELDVDQDGQELARFNWAGVLGVSPQHIQVTAFDSQEQLEFAVLQIIEQGANEKRAAEIEVARKDPGRRAAIAACPTPVYHETHRYCPSCPWTENDG